MKNNFNQMMHWMKIEDPNGVRQFSKQLNNEEINQIIQSESKLEKDRTPLTFALARYMAFPSPKRKMMIEILLDNGANIDLADGRGIIPLFDVILNKPKDAEDQKDIIQLLLSRGAKIDQPIPDANGMTPLSYAIESQEINTVRYLLAPATDKVSIIKKEKNSYLAFISRLIDIGDIELIDKFALDQNQQNDLDRNDLNILLLHAIKRGQGKVAEFLISKGAKIDTKDSYLSLTFISGLIDMGDTAVIEKFALDRNDLTTLLLHAIKRREGKVAEFLISKGAKIDIKRSDITEITNAEITTKSKSLRDDIILRSAGYKVEIEGSYTLYSHEDKINKNRRVVCVVSGADFNGAMDVSFVDLLLRSGYNVVFFDARKNPKKEFNSNELETFVKRRKDLGKLDLIVINSHGGYVDTHHAIEIQQGVHIRTVDCISQIVDVFDVKQNFNCIITSCYGWSALKDLRLKAEEKRIDCQVIALSQYEEIGGQIVKRSDNHKSSLEVEKKLSPEISTMAGFIEFFAQEISGVGGVGAPLYLKTWGKGHEYVLGEVTKEVKEGKEIFTLVPMKFGKSSVEFERAKADYNLEKNGIMQTDIMKKHEEKYKKLSNFAEIAINPITALDQLRGAKNALKEVENATMTEIKQEEQTNIKN